MKNLKKVSPENLELFLNKRLKDKLLKTNIFVSRVALRVYGYLSFDCPLVYERAIPERTIVLDFLTNFFL